MWQYPADGQHLNVFMCEVTYDCIQQMHGYSMILLVSACAGGSTSRLTPKTTFLAIFQKRSPVFGQSRQNPIPIGTDRNTSQDFVLWYVMLSEGSRGIPNGCVLAHKNLKQGVKEMPEISTITLVITLPTQHNKDHTTPCQKFYFSMFDIALMQENIGSVKLDRYSIFDIRTSNIKPVLYSIFKINPWYI